jgi:Putative DNA-binding domain
MSAPSTTETSLDVALEHIEAEQTVWVRAAAGCDARGEWLLRLVELTSGEAPPSFAAKIWDYPNAVFVADQRSGTQVADELRGGRLELNGRDFTLPELTDSATWERKQSQAATQYERVPWPVIETTLSRTTGTGGDPQGHLVAEGDAPSFLNFYAAAACFFWLDRQPAGGSLHQGVMYRHLDTRGRINLVRIGDDQVEVDVEGDEIRSMSVELAAEVPGPCVRIGEDADATTVRFGLDDGLPQGSWVLLRRGAEWLDRRFLSVPHSRGDNAGIEVVVDSATRLEALLASRERQQVEFKRQLPADDRSKRKVMKTVCAFANEVGGSLLIGVDDDRNLVGLEPTTVERTRDQLTQMVGSWLDPRPSSHFEILPIADSNKVILELQVDAGPYIYGCGLPGEVRVAYVRHHGVTEKATIAEIAVLIQSHTPGRRVSPFARR